MNYAQLLFPDFSLILCGYLVCRYTRLNNSVWEQAEVLVYYLFFPVLLFHSIVKSPLDIGIAARLMGASVSLGLVGIALAYAIPHMPFLKTKIAVREHAASAQVAFRFNTVIGLAVAERLAGAQGVQFLAIIIGVYIPLVNVGAVWPMVRHGQSGFLRELARNPLIIATVSGLAANLLGFTLPEWLVPTVSRLGAASLALGLMTAGAGMHFQALARAKALGISLLTIRHLLLPVVTLFVARVFALSGTQSMVLLAFSALPTSSACYVLATRMGFEGGYVGGLVALSTLLGMVSLPFALGVLGNF